MARYGDGYYGGWAPYVSVAERRQKAAKRVAAMQKKGKTVSPVHIEGRTITKTFWGKAWCDNLESYSDYSNRLPRGRTYVRNGSVVDLQIGKGEVTALVSGSSLYTVKVGIHALEKPRWKTIIERCSGQIDSLVELLQGKFSRGVMEIITCKERGLFPSPRGISMDCSCPDSATMCKHVAAVLYGVGARLDESPELFFQLRNVDQCDLITAAGTATAVARTAKPTKTLKSENLSALFGINLDSGLSPESSMPAVTDGPSAPKKRLSTAGKSKVKKIKPKKKALPVRKKR